MKGLFSFVAAVLLTWHAGSAVTNFIEPWVPVSFFMEEMPQEADSENWVPDFLENAYYATTESVDWTVAVAQRAAFLALVVPTLLFFILYFIFYKILKLLTS